MILLCFSSEDGQEPSRELLRYMERFEIPVLYDPESFPEETDYDPKGLKSRLNKARYAIVLITQSSVLSTCVQEEIHQLSIRYQNKSIRIFPVLYGIRPQELPQKWQYFTRMMYYETKEESGIYSICGHILCHILMDELEKYPFTEMQTFILQNQDVPLMSYPVSLLNAYSTVDDNNQKAKISLLYALYVYIKNSYNLNAIPKFYYAGIHKIFDVARLQIPVDATEAALLEQLVLLLLNAVLFGRVY